MTINPNQYYIVRAARAGVFFGRIKENTAESVTMIDVRKLWFWSGAAAVEQIAVDGVTNPSTCKFTRTVEEMEILEPIQVIPCTDKAVACIKAVKPWMM